MLPGIVKYLVLLGRPRARHALVACGLVVGLLLAAGTTMQLLASRRSAIADAGQGLKNLALVLAEEADRRFQAMQQLQLDLIEHLQELGIDTVQKFEQELGSQQVNLDLRRRVAMAPEVGALVLISRFGEVVNISRPWPFQAVNVRDRDYFRAIAEQTGAESFISAPQVNRVTGQWTIVIARPFNALDGRLLGVISSSMQIDSFEQFFGRISGQGNPSFVLFRRDGMLLVRFPRRDSVIGKSYGGRPEFHVLLEAQDHTILRRPSMLDGTDRLVAPHLVAHFPLLIAATNTVDAALANWLAQARSLAGATVLAELVVAGIVVLGVRQLRIQERLAAAGAAAVRAEAARALAESQLALAHQREAGEREALLLSQRFDVALSNMLQGLIMCDAGGHVLVVNRRFIELFGLPEQAARAAVTYNDMLNLAVCEGNITEDDAAALRAWREAALASRARAVLTWELADGRVMMATHQPMPDGWLASYEDITERRQAHLKLAYMAHHDALTGLPNRAMFHDRLEEAMAHARRGKPLALLFLDLDQFKEVNDTLGHPAGDALLQAVAQRLTQRVRETDTVARLGGDEFAIIQTEVEKPTAAADFADRVIAMFEEPFEVTGHQVVIGTSIGIAFAPDDARDANDLLKNADLALYRAKSDGRGVYRLFHTAMDAEIQARRVLELDLRQALREGEFELYYQPLIDLRRQATSGFEALLRWHHPQHGLVSPDRFIPLAEEIGAIVPIGAWVLRQACLAAAGWPEELRVSVNLSPVQFRTRELVATVSGALAAAGLAPRRLELEITEAIMLQDTVATLATLHELRKLGVSIAMDDFGTGYSSLSYLRRFPFDRIKIDQSFVRELGQQRDCGAIVRAVIGLSHELGMATTAEGVETREQLCALAMAGCSDIQGYLFSRPVPLREIPAVLRAMPLVADLLPQAALVA